MQHHVRKLISKRGELWHVTMSGVRFGGSATISSVLLLAATENCLLRIHHYFRQLLDSTVANCENTLYFIRNCFNGSL